MLYRNAILQVLKEGRHIRAEDIFHELKKRHPLVSITTVYRNIKTLEQKGVIVGFSHPDGSVRYEAKQGEIHQHLVCQDCGRVYEVKFGFLGQLQESLKERVRFEITTEYVSLVGRCATCK